ncbi:MAG: hypothetical protein IKC35_03310 [Clostridia bacterium]|nr:hypothetical protein [Clostridia bacterium]
MNRVCFVAHTYYMICSKCGKDVNVNSVCYCDKCATSYCHRCASGKCSVCMSELKFFS